MPWYGWVATAATVLVLLVIVGLFVLGRPGVNVKLARELFLRRRQELQAEFFRAAAASGKPRGLRWTRCDWGSAVEFARERDTGRLAALVGVTIQFEAVEGSDMEGLPAVGNLRNASGVFFFDRGDWRTVGRAVFNLGPAEALAHFGQQYERVAAEQS